jgi:signal transduction histidine kinase
VVSANDPIADTGSEPTGQIEGETADDRPVPPEPDTDPEPVGLRAVLEAEIDGVRSNYSEAALTVDGTIPDVRVRADELLESVFRNLLSNAIQHNDTQVPEVTVSVSITDDTAEIRIADNGPGIPDDRKETVFGKGEKGLDSDGTGIGLYLVNTLVEQYGGAVRIDDATPRGTVVTVELRTASSGR